MYTYVHMRVFSVWTHNLQFDGLAIQLDGADLKVHPDGADVTLSVGVILQRGRQIKKGRKGQDQASSIGRRDKRLPLEQKH